MSSDSLSTSAHPRFPVSARPSQGLIQAGWVMVHYCNRAVFLLGRGDFLHDTFLEAPLSTRGVGRFSIDRDAEAPVSTWQDVARLARQTARLSASALSRTADLFVELMAKNDNGEGHPAVIELPISQEMLGQLLGISPVHMNRVLQELRRRNIVSHCKGQFTVMDAASCNELASEVGS